MAEFHPPDNFVEIRDDYDLGTLTLDDVDGADELFYKKKYFLHGPKSIIFNPSVVFPDILEDYEGLKRHMTSLTEDNGVFKKILRQGDGNTVPLDSDVYIHYNSFLEHNDEPFDSTEITKDLYVVKLEDQKELLGFQLAIKSMEYNEVAQFIFTPKYFYGPLGCPPRIPKGSSAMFFIEVLDIKVPKPQKKIYAMSFDELLQVPFKDVEEAVKKLKDAGNQKYAIYHYEEAILRYKLGIRTLKNYFCTSENDETAKNELQLTLVANLAQCYLKIDDTAKVVQVCKAALKPGMPKPSNAKLHFRYAKALFIQKNLDTARLVVNDGMAIAPNNQALKRLENKIKAALERRERNGQTLKTGFPSFRGR